MVNNSFVKYIIAKDKLRANIKKELSEEYKEELELLNNIIDVLLEPIIKAYSLYLKELKYGKSAYAANFAKFLALYRQEQGFVFDIGVNMMRKFFLPCVKSIVKILQFQSHQLLCGLIKIINN